MYMTRGRRARLLWHGSSVARPARVHVRCCRRGVLHDIDLARTAFASYARARTYMTPAPRPGPVLVPAPAGTIHRYRPTTRDLRVSSRVAWTTRKVHASRGFSGPPARHARREGWGGGAGAKSRSPCTRRQRAACAHAHDHDDVRVWMWATRL